MTSNQRMLLESAFSPSAPITSEAFFTGRYDQLVRAVEAINQRGQHFVVYGERGVGKTSFANIVCTKLQNVVTAKVTCNREDDFKQLWRRALSKVQFSRDKFGIGYTAEKSIEIIQGDMFLPQQNEIDSIDIQNILEKIQVNLLFVFDEYDSVVEPGLRTKFADTIKNLSDNAPHVTIGLVGIAQDVKELIGGHASIERCLKQIRIPGMSSGELNDIISKGLGALNIGIDPAVRSRIVYFSSGFPHYTHLLSKYSARRCIEASENVIVDRHYKSALDQALDDATQSIQDAYQLATLDAKHKKSRFEKVINACSVCEEDQFGTFAIKDVVKMYNQMNSETLKAQNLTYNVQKLCEDDKGRILTRVGDSTNVRFRFTNPLMRVFVRMKLDKAGKFDQHRLPFGAV